MKIEQSKLTIWLIGALSLAAELIVPVVSRLPLQLRWGLSASSVLFLTTRQAFICQLWVSALALFYFGFIHPQASQLPPHRLISILIEPLLPMVFAQLRKTKKSRILISCVAYYGTLAIFYSFYRNQLARPAYYDLIVALAITLALFYALRFASDRSFLYQIILMAGLFRALILVGLTIYQMFYGQHTDALFLSFTFILRFLPGDLMTAVLFAIVVPFCYRSLRSW